jgi:hypothetical protein
MTGRGTIHSADSFLPIANYFGVSLDYLMGNKEQRNDCALLLHGFKEILARVGLSDSSFDEDGMALYLEWLETFTDQFLKIKKLDNPASKGGQKGATLE